LRITEFGGRRYIVTNRAGNSAPWRRRWQIQRQRQRRDRGVGRHSLSDSEAISDLGLRVSILGCLAGLAMAGMLFGVTLADASALTGVVTIMLAVAIAASRVPAIRPYRMEPLLALRDD